MKKRLSKAEKTQRLDELSNRTVRGILQHFSLPETASNLIFLKDKVAICCACFHKQKELDIDAQA